MAGAYPKLYMHIAGEDVDAGPRRTHQVINPATGAVLGELPLADGADLDRALETAATAYKTWRARPAAERGEVLKRAAHLLHERTEEIARIATLEEGKTLAETRFEMHIAISLFQFYGEEAQRTYGRVLVRPSGRRSIVVKEPVGPVAAFAPWNFPIGNPARKLSAPIAAGCSVILKPAEESPASALAILQALLDAGLPKGVAQVEFGVPDEVSRHLLASPVIRKLSFTGSTVVGKHLTRLAADNSIRTTMELGGHAPVLVFDDADLEGAMDMMAFSKRRNAGQVCTCPTRFYVQEGVYGAFVEGMTARMALTLVGDGLDAKTQMGPMANPRRIEAMDRLIGDAKKHGAKLKTGGARIGNAGFFWQPTVLADVPNEAAIMNEEPFGPVAVVAPFRTFDEAIEQANRLPYGLASYAFTRDAKTAMLVGEAIEAGMVGVNTNIIAGADSPFGGVKDSGSGKEDGPEGLDSYMITKAIHQA
jgi:succinate-semialdehyde dehydrogenase/glutarate-semialdehyde dehydrogenase